MTSKLLRDALRHARRCPACLKNRQPETTNGSPEHLVERGVERAAKLTGQFAERLVAAVDGKSSAKAIKGALSSAASSFPLVSFSKAIEEELLIGLMLGALDSAIEADTEDQIEVATFDAKDPRFTSRPMADAIKSFLSKRVVTKDVFDEMTDAAKKRAFTVAGLASESMVGVVQSELANRIDQGADLRDFKRFAETRLAGSGWTPSSPSHVETIFRTNVLGAYNGGRHRQMTQPDVLAFRPYVQILTPNDGPPRQRPAHQKTHARVFRLDDPAFEPPPWDFNCRCRGRSMSQRQFDKLGLTLTDGSFLKSLELPAPGFGGSGDIDGDLFGPKVKKIPPPPKEPAPAPPPAPPAEPPAPRPRRPRKAPAPKPPPPAPPPPAPKPEPKPERKPRAPRKPAPPPPEPKPAPAPPPEKPKAEPEPKPKKAPPPKPAKTAGIDQLQATLDKSGTTLGLNVVDAESAGAQASFAAVDKGLKRASRDGKSAIKRLELTEFTSADDSTVENRLPAGCGGMYFGGGPGVLRVKVNRGAIEDKWARAHKLTDAESIPFNTAFIAKDVDEVIEMVTVHEYGHHLHIEKRNWNATKVNAKIFDAFNDPDRQDVSEYARHNHLEYWAESYSAYQYYPRAWMTKHAPKVIRFVEEILGMING